MSMNDLSNYRKSYEKSELLEHMIPEDPINLFHKWFHEVKDFGGVDEVNAMTVSTLGLDGFPKSRVLLLKKFTYEGFIFYTNYNSNKGTAIAHNNKAHVLIYWPELERQIRISGLVEKVPEEMSDAYFSSRPYGSKIGAWASNQSDTLSSRQELEQKVEEYSHKFPADVPRPPHWGGYLVRPVKVEFWQGRPSRLHDRIVYEMNETTWKLYRINP